MNTSRITSKERQNRRGERSSIKPIVRRALVGLLAARQSSIFLLFGRQKRRLGLFSWATTWHCPSLCVLRPGKRFGHRSCDDVCCARLALLGDNQPNHAPNGADRATVDRRRQRSLFPALIGWLLFFLFLGALSQALGGSANTFLVQSHRARAPSAPTKTTGSDFGGGFAGVTTAAHL